MPRAGRRLKAAASRGVVAVVLAGGRSRRWGRDKAGEMLAGKPLLQHVAERCALVSDRVLVVGRQGQELPALEVADLQHLMDIYPEAGPIGGLFTGLRYAQSDRVLAVACDMPFVAPELLRRLVELLPGSDAVVPLAAGRLQPLCAAYSASCLEPLQNHIESGRLSLTDFLHRMTTTYLDRADWQAYDPEGHSFLNLNRPADLEAANALLAPADG